MLTKEQKDELEKKNELYAQMVKETQRLKDEHEYLHTYMEVFDKRFKNPYSITEQDFNKLKPEHAFELRCSIDRVKASERRMEMEMLMIKDDHEHRKQKQKDAKAIEFGFLTAFLVFIFAFCLIYFS